MATLTVLYPFPGTKFDRDYYNATHGPLVHKTWDSNGLKSLDVVFGETAPGGGDPAFHCIATLKWESRAALDAALAAPSAGPVFGDIPNFTDSVSVAVIGTEA